MTQVTRFPAAGVRLPRHDRPASPTGFADGLRLPPRELLDSALCAQTDPEAFFPEKGQSAREAKRICARCEVRTSCLEYALANRERHGVWGGLTALQRARLLRQRHDGQADEQDREVA